MEQRSTDVDGDNALRQIWTVPASTKTPPSLQRRPGVYKRMTCRYGRGCTHIHDPVHQERFTHPTIPFLDGRKLVNPDRIINNVNTAADQVRNHYMCNECGFSFLSLPDLQIHLQRKTAWSNNSLLGSRICCLIDNKEWHEGIVMFFHRSGKHCVEFRAIGEKRWLNMKKLAFYVIEQHQPEQASSNEYKENDGEVSGYLGLDREEWSYIEDISLDFAFAQSVLFKVFGGVIQETGHKTRGHVSLTEEDREIARTVKGSLLYGELLPRGVNKALGPDHLDAASYSVLYDLGMGTGKVLIQAFLQFRNLTRVYGIELSMGRYIIAQEAALRMVNLLGKDSFMVECIDGVCLVVTEKPMDGSSTARTLCMECGNMMTVEGIEQADVVMLETDVPQDIQRDLCVVLSRMHAGARTLTYHDIRKMWSSDFPFKQFEINRYLTDRFPTSWSVQRGHHFFLWEKMTASTSTPLGLVPRRPANCDVDTAEDRGGSLRTPCSGADYFGGNSGTGSTDMISRASSSSSVPSVGSTCCPSIFFMFRALRWMRSPDNHHRRTPVRSEGNEKVIPVNAPPSPRGVYVPLGRQNSALPPPVHPACNAVIPKRFVQSPSASISGKTGHFKTSLTPKSVPVSKSDSDDCIVVPPAAKLGKEDSGRASALREEQTCS